MATTRGRCTNVDYCSLASAKRDIEVKLGQDFVCPECGKPLRPPPMDGASRGSGMLVGGVAAVVLICGGLYAGYRLSGPQAKAPAAPLAMTPMSPRPAPAPMTAPVATAPAAMAPVPPAKPEQAILLRLDAGPAAHGLAPKLAAAYLASLGDTAVTIQADPATGGMQVTGSRLGRPETIAIAPTGSGQATKSPHGAADVVLAAPASPAASADDHPVALDAVAVVVNPRNTLGTISLAQLRGVLDGNITRWSQLGGTGGPIHVIWSSDPSADGLVALVPGTASPGGTRVADAAARVAADPDAVALLPRGLTGQGKLLALAATGARPTLPGASAVANDLYPLVRHLSLTAPVSGGNPIAARFVAFALSPEGQAAVSQAGFVPLHVAAEPAPVQASAVAPATPKDRYRQLVTGATRLAADLHFEASSNKLDLHSAREVDRVWNFMMSDHTPSDHLILLGFADNQGTPEANLALSQQRAQAVAAVFARRGLPPGQIVPFGADLPVADNATEAGREKNRRVEVFLRN